MPSEVYLWFSSWASQMKDKLELTELGQLEWPLDPTMAGKGEGKKDNISGWAVL